MPASKSSTKARRPTTKKKKKADSSIYYNQMDPFNQYPNYQTGEEEYGPIPPFGYNPHDPLNMKPFNPNVLGAVFGGSPAPITYGGGVGNILMPPPFNLLGVPAGIPNPAAPLLQPMVPPLSVSAPPGVVAPAYPSAYGLGGTVSQQYYHPTDPNNQFPHPQTGSMTEPGPALAGGMNPYDPYNVIGAPGGTRAQNAAMRRKMKAQPRHPQSPYILE